MFWGTSTLFSIVAVWIYIPINSAQKFLFLHILANTCYHLSFWWQPFLQVWGDISLCVDFITLMISNVKHIFHISVGHLYEFFWILFSIQVSVQFSCSVMSNSLQPHGPQHARLPCPSPSPGVYSTHVHWVGDAIQPSHPLLSPSLPAFNLSQYQGLLQWVSSLHQVAKVLEFQLQHQSFQWMFRTGLIKLGYLKHGVSWIRP